VRTAIWTVLILLSTAEGSPLEAQSASDHVTMGVAADDAHDPGTALEHFRAALKEDSLNYEANWRAALTVLDLTELLPDSLRRARRDSLYALAEHYATRAVASDSMGAAGHFALAAAIGSRSVLLGNEARIRRAAIIRREALKAISLDPRHDGAYHILGRWNAEIMRLSGISRFVARKFLGADVFKQASWKNAVAYMEKAVALDPGRIQHHLELARIYADRKRAADAATQLRLVQSLPFRENADSLLKQQGAVLSRKLAKR
jgi:regulator of microtubule dynamics protein 3